MVIHLLILIGNGHSAQTDFCPPTSQCHFCSITSRSIVQCHPVQQHITASLLIHIQVIETYRTVMSFFQFIQVEYSILSCKDFHHLSRKEIHVVHRMVAYQQPGLCTILQYNQDTTVYHEIHIRTQDIHQLDWTFQHHILRYIHAHTVLCKHRIKCRQSILRRISQLSVIFSDQIRALFSHIPQATEVNPLRQLSRRMHMLVKRIIYHKIK